MVVLASLLVFGGCRGKKFEQAMTLGGQAVSADTLNEGLAVYKRYCVGCHGDDGDGDTPAARAMRPRPRDFTLGQFEFVSVAKGELPTDEDLGRTIRNGLVGTDMAPVPGMTEDELNAVVQYIKTLSPRWKDERAGRPIAVAPDPWEERPVASAIERGRDVYHAVARCWSCHPAYASRAEIVQMMGKLPAGKGLPSSAIRERLGEPVPLASALGTLRPPDFLADSLRSGQTEKDILRSVSTGLGSSPMPAWSETLSDEDLWAVVHYVRTLVRAKGTPAAGALRHRVSPSATGESSLSPPESAEPAPRKEG